MMDIQTLTAFFKWCAIINFGLYLYWVIMCIKFPDLVYRIQNSWFPLPRETFNVVIYAFLGVYKIIFLVFVLIPYVALLIIQ